jgi:hypothetical protein
MAHLEQGSKLLDCESGVTDDSAQSKRVDGVVTRNGEDARPVGHDEVFPLSDYGEPGLLKGPQGIQMIYAGNLRQG